MLEILAIQNHLPSEPARPRQYLSDRLGFDCSMSVVAIELSSLQLAFDLFCW
jgi:hypothetical protein